MWKKLEKNVNTKCPTCGTINPKTAKFCIKCGKNLTNNDLTNKKSSEKTETKDETKTEDKNKLDLTTNKPEPEVSSWVGKSEENMTEDELVKYKKSLERCVWKEDDLELVGHEPTDEEKKLVETLENADKPEKKTGEADRDKSKTRSSKDNGLPSSIPDKNLINQKDNKKTCTSCGSKNLKTAKFCVVCGEKFTTETIENPDLKINDDKKDVKSSEINDPFEKIKKAKELLDIGAITEEEFESIKSKYINEV